MFSSTTFEFWTSARISFIVRTLAFLMLVGIGASFIRDAQSLSSVWKGDFPTFYSGAVALHNYGQERLYDTKLQFNIQQKYWPNLKGSYAPFVYPPYVGAIISPLGALGPKEGLLVFVGFMFTCFVLAAWIFSKTVALAQSHFIDTTCILFLYAPISGGIFGSQNSALSLLCYIAMLYFAQKDTKYSEFTAGIFCGLWLFKPQYPILFLLCCAFSKRWKILAGASIPALSFYLIGAHLNGFLWPISWLKIVSDVHKDEMLLNASMHVSFKGFFTALGILSNSHHLQLFQLVGSLLSFALLGMFLYLFWALGKNTMKDLQIRKSDFIDLLYSLGPAIVLISPHAHYYDLAMCAPLIGRFFSPKRDLDITFLFFVFVATLGISSSRHLLAINPLILLPLSLTAIGIRSHSNFVSSA